ncbi:hypothetical protein ACPA9J_03435 [Pseudomonas aeruginosa]
MAKEQEGRQRRQAQGRCGRHRHCPRLSARRDSDTLDRPRGLRSHSCTCCRSNW